MSGHRYFRSAIIKVQARVRTVIPYVANYSLAQFFVGLFFVGNARPRKLNSHKNFCVYSSFEEESGEETMEEIVARLTVA